MIHYAPTHHVGHYTFPAGCAHAWVYNCPYVTSVTFPEGCNEAAVDNCPSVTSIDFPKGCTIALVVNCPGVTSITFPEGCTEAVVNDCPGVTSLTFPAGCTRARVYNCPEYKSLFDDPRGYQMVYVGGFYHACCRKFTAAEAIAHWGADSYPDRARGEAYVEAITAHEAKLQTEATA